MAHSTSFLLTVIGEHIFRMIRANNPVKCRKGSPGELPHFRRISSLIFSNVLEIPQNLQKFLRQPLLALLHERLRHPIVCLCPPNKVFTIVHGCVYFLREDVTLAFSVASLPFLCRRPEYQNHMNGFPNNFQFLGRGGSATITFVT